MKKKTWEELWKDFDSKDEDKLGLEKLEICSKILEEVEQLKKHEIERELVLLRHFRMLEMNYDNFENLNFQRISEEIEIFLQNCDKGSYDYYLKRFSDTSSYLNKWRYAFACWLLKKNQTNHFDDAISSLSEYILKKTSEKKYQEQFHYIVIRYNIPKIYGYKESDPKFIQTLTQLIFEVDNTENFRWTLEPLKILCEIAKPIKPELFYRFLTVEHRSAHKLRLQGSHPAEQMHLNLTLNLCNAANIDPKIKQELKDEIHCMIAESNEDAAEKSLKINNPLLAVMCYQNAVKEYQAGAKEKTKELLEEIRKATEKIEWVEVKAGFSLPILMIKGNNGYERVHSISNLTPNIPNQDQTENLAKEIMKKNPILSAVRRVYFNPKNPTKTSTDEKEIFQSTIMEENIRSILIGEKWLSNAVLELEEQNLLSPSNFIDYLQNIGLHDKEQMELIKTGIYEHFKLNYIASIHILIPQIEGTLRSLLKTKGILTLKQYQETIMDSELGGILSNPEVEKFLGRDLATFLKVKFTEYDGINLRNDVSHALRLISDFTHNTSFSLIQIILILSKLSV